MLLCIVFFLIFGLRLEVHPGGIIYADFFLRALIYGSLVFSFFFVIARWFRLDRWRKVSLFISELALMFGLIFIPSLIDYIIERTPEVRLYLSAFVPAFFSVALLSFTVKSRRNKITNNTEWRGVEEIITNIGPEINGVALIADIVGFLVASNLIPTCLLPLLWLTFTFATISIVFMLGNWYTTKLVFRHEIIELGDEKVYLVANQRHRSSSWLFLNITFTLLVWVIWGIVDIAAMYVVLAQNM